MREPKLILAAMQTAGPLFSHHKATAADWPASGRPAGSPAGSPAVGSAPAAFLPTSRAEMEALGWRQCDVIIVTGDAYVDHPSFGMAIIGRVLASSGAESPIRIGARAQRAAVATPRARVPA